MSHTVKMFGRSLPVPYVAAWSSEMDGEWEIRPDPILRGMNAWFAKNGGIGDGKPVLGKMDPTRVREVVINELCQVCRKKLGKHRFAPNLGRSHPYMTLLSEPWACLSCAKLAEEFCPGLKKRRHKWLRLIDWKVDLVTTIDPSWDPESGTPRPLSPTAIGYVYLAVLVAEEAAIGDSADA